MKKIILFLLASGLRSFAQGVCATVALAALPTICMAQGSCILFPSQNVAGQALTTATTYICAKGTAPASCTGGVNVYSDDSLTAPYLLTQPLHTDTSGNTYACATPGTYKVCVSAPGTSSPYCWNQTFSAVATGTGPSGASLSASPSSLTFANVAIGGSSPSQSVSITNTSAVLATIGSIATTGDFSSSNNCGPSLAAGATCSATVIFSPTASGARTGTLSISFSGSGSPVQVSLSGNGETNPVTLSSIAVTPANPSLALPGTQQFTATGTYSDSHTANLTNASVWNSGTTATATISTGGLATGVAAGTSTISDAGAQYMQSAAGAVTASATTQTASFTSPNQSGDTLVALVGWNDTTAPTVSVTDSAGNTYSASGCTASHGNGNSMAIFVANGIPAYTSNTVTATFGASVTNPNLVVGEYSGLSATSVVDACNITNGTATTTPSVSVTTVNATDLIVGGISSSGTVTSATAPDTLRTPTNQDYSLQDTTVFSAGSQTVAETTSSAAFAMGAVALKSVVGTTTLTVTGSAPTTYYVNGSTGSDSNTCAQAQSSSTPFATIQHAQDQIANSTCSQGSAGTIVQVAAGTYTGGLNIQASGTASARLRFLCAVNSESVLASGGTGTCKISLTGASSQTAVVKLGANANPPTAGNYVDLVGFEITGDTTTTSGILGWGKFDRYYFNVVHDVGYAACGTSAGVSGMTIGANYNASDDWAIGNIVYNIPASPSTTIPTNCTDVTGLYFANPNFVGMDNLIYATAQHGIQTYHAATNGVLSYNTVAHNGFATGPSVCGSGMLLSNSLSSLATTMVSSNIAYDNCGNGIRIYSGVANTTIVSTNLLYSNGSGNYNNSGNTNVACGNCIFSNPLFTAYSFSGFQMNGFQLGAGSPGINKGVNSCAGGGLTPCAPAYDIAGRVRPNSFVNGVGQYYLGVWDTGTNGTWPWF